MKKPDIHTFAIPFLWLLLVLFAVAMLTACNDKPRGYVEVKVADDYAIARLTASCESVGGRPVWKLYGEGGTSYRFTCAPGMTEKEAEQAKLLEGL